MASFFVFVIFGDFGSHLVFVAFALQCRNNDPVQKRDYELHHVRLLHTLAETAHHIEARRYAR